ncbi:PhzF family phenazine biosynthesis protein [Taklimakanibacter deserti]|uniref:PhzF family phenazine biosynthesis protein n=1 Tax=Taklimakanibacter deserti TaxID=2267839 RepID=UPI000E65715E
MELKFNTLDVFTNRRFGGNPVAIVHDADALTTEQMQTITREFNLSETVFVMKPKDPGNTARVRIFFPGGEMPFAGHPTLGCAVLLAEMKHKPGCSFETEIRLEEVAGLVPVKVSRIGDAPHGLFKAPVVPQKIADGPAKADIAAALGISADEIGFDAHRPMLIEGGPAFFFVPVPSRAILERVRPCEPAWSALMAALGEHEAYIDAAYVYTRGGDGKDVSFRSRMFAPGGGIPEDPATGSATALLARQLLIADRLKDGKHRFILEQGYEMKRPSDLVLEADVAQGDLVQVRVGGQAVRVSTGTITV